MNRQLIERFLTNKFLTEGEGPYLTWIVDFILKSKAEQKTEFDAWKEGERVRVARDLAALDARTLETQAALTAELNVLTNP